MLLLLGCVAACGATGSSRRGESDRADERTLARDTLVRARAATLVLSADWRAEAELTGATVEDRDGGVQVARGRALFRLRKLQVEATDSIKVTWLPDHADLLVSARDVELFTQQRDRALLTEDLAMVTMANDQVSFFKQ